MRQSLTFLSVISLTFSTAVLAGSFTLTSNDITQDKFMNKAQEYNGFGCDGGDLSPHLKWSNIPVGTKSFAITAYDPDAPTGSGWWHWQVVNIPLTTLEIATGSGSQNQNSILEKAMQIENDYGGKSYGGACPPVGHGVHRYRFTVHALSVAKLLLPEGASGALAGYMINAHTIETSTIEALYQRD